MSEPGRAETGESIEKRNDTHRCHPRTRQRDLDALCLCAVSDLFAVMFLQQRWAAVRCDESRALSAAMEERTSRQNGKGRARSLGPCHCPSPGLLRACSALSAAHISLAAGAASLLRIAFTVVRHDGAAHATTDSRASISSDRTNLTRRNCAARPAMRVR